MGRRRLVENSSSPTKVATFWLKFSAPSLSTSHHPVRPIFRRLWRRSRRPSTRPTSLPSRRRSPSSSRSQLCPASWTGPTPTTSTPGSSWSASQPFPRHDFRFQPYPTIGKQSKSLITGHRCKWKKIGRRIIGFGLMSKLGRLIEVFLLTSLKESSLVV